MYSGGNLNGGKRGYTKHTRPLTLDTSEEFAYRPTPQTRDLLFTFRRMVNDAIRVCFRRTSGDD